jgi:hypothetical protein
MLRDDDRAPFSLATGSGCDCSGKARLRRERRRLDPRPLHAFTDPERAVESGREFHERHGQRARGPAAARRLDEIRWPCSTWRRFASAKAERVRMTRGVLWWLLTVTAAACSPPPPAPTRVEPPASSPQASATSPIAPIAPAAPTPSPQATPTVPASYRAPATPTASSTADTTPGPAIPKNAAPQPDADAPRAPESRAKCLENCRRRARVSDCADEQGGLMPCPCDCQ